MHVSFVQYVENFLELLHQRLGHRSTRLLLAGDTANVWEDI